MKHLTAWWYPRDRKYKLYGPDRREIDLNIGLNNLLFTRIPRPKGVAETPIKIYCSVGAEKAPGQPGVDLARLIILAQSEYDEELWVVEDSDWGSNIRKAWDNAFTLCKSGCEAAELKIPAEIIEYRRALPADAAWTRIHRDKRECHLSIWVTFEPVEQKEQANG